MQIVSEIAEIVASAIDCVLVLWFLTSHFGKKKTIEWWKYAVWFVILFITSHFMGEMFNLQSIIVILIVTSFSMIYLQGNSIEKLIVSLILYIMLAFVNLFFISCFAVKPISKKKSIFLERSYILHFSLLRCLPLK